MVTFEGAVEVNDLTLVIDIGKSHAKLLMVDAKGDVLERYSKVNASVMTHLGYPALDIQGLSHWMQQCLRNSDLTAHCARIIATTHGAAFVALSDEGVAWSPLDYEFDGFATTVDALAHPLSDSLPQSYAAKRDDFASTLSPDLPAGLNAARQLYWMQYNHPQAWAQTRYVLPYPQYWAWLLSGVRASEASSLGCHTQLWRPQVGKFSQLALAQGWDALFAPLRPAWEVLGPVRADIAKDWGLSATCVVHVGVHDSNACLARYLDTNAPEQAKVQTPATALTVVSSGTWTVLMAPGAPTACLTSEFGMLGNVDVFGRATPTARFMGGRDFSQLLEGAAADAGSWADIERLLAHEIWAVPSKSIQNHSRVGAAIDQEVKVYQRGLGITAPLSQILTDGERAAIAALYCAQHTAWLVRKLWAESTLASRRVIVEGPLAHNVLYRALLQSLLPNYNCQFSTDDLEGTARGAWLLSQSGAQGGMQFLQTAPRREIAGLSAYNAQWLAFLQQ